MTGVLLTFESEVVRPSARGSASFTQHVSRRGRGPAGRPAGRRQAAAGQSLPGILPDLGPAEALDGRRISRKRPFRDRHHSASMAALTGGGLRVRPGEVSMAHLGVLFLDELPEFERGTRFVTLAARSRGSDGRPRQRPPDLSARVQLVAAMNPCRCGHLGDPALACSRAPHCAADYQSKVSGPLLYRIDLHVEVDPVSAMDLALPPPAEGSAEVAARVRTARAIQTERLADTEMRSNAELMARRMPCRMKPGASF